MTEKLLTFFTAIILIFKCAAVGTGLQALLSLARFSTSFGFPTPPPLPSPPKKSDDPASHTTSPTASLAYVSLIGVRQLGTGVILLVFAIQGKWIEMAYIAAIIGVLVAGTDALFLARVRSLGGAAVIAALAVAAITGHD